MNEVKFLHLVEEVLYPTGIKEILSADTIPYKEDQEMLQLAEEHLGQLVGIEVEEVKSKDGKEVAGIRLIGMLDEASYSEGGHTRPAVYIPEIEAYQWQDLLKDNGYLKERETNVRLS